MPSPRRLSLTYESSGVRSVRPGRITVAAPAEDRVGPARVQRTTRSCCATRAGDTRTIGLPDSYAALRAGTIRKSAHNCWSAPGNDPRLRASAPGEQPLRDQRASNAHV